MSEDILSAFDYYAQHSPDFIELSKSKQKEFILFVYDGMKMGHKNHGILKNANYYGRASTLTPSFLLRDAGGQGVAFHIPSKERKFEDGKSVDRMHLSYIHGELYGVSLRVVSDIDFLSANGSMMHRIKRFFSPCDVPNRRQNAIEGYIYIGDQKYYGESEGILKRTRRCYDVTMGGLNGFYWGADPRTDTEVREEMYEEAEAYGYGDHFNFGRGMVY